MHLNPQSQWSKMWDALKAVLTTTPISEFEKAFGRLDAKTDFNGRFFARVAERLGYKLYPEFLRVDFVIRNADNIPIAFIESENIHPTAGEEIEKLCVVSAPVKFLMLSCEWSDSERAAYLPGWKQRIALQHQYFGEDCIYVIVIGEWGRGKPQDDGVLRYIFDVIDSQGREIKHQEIEIPNSCASPVSVVQQKAVQPI